MAENEFPLLFRQLVQVKPQSMSLNQWLVSAGVNRSFFTDLRKSGRARSDTIEKLLGNVGLTPAQFYALAPPEASPEALAGEKAAAALPFRREDEARDIPVLGTALGADFEINDDGTIIFAEVTDVDLNEVVDHVRRPPALKHRRDVYSLTIVGSSMSPRFDPGDPAYFDPKATPRIGDDVVVYLIKRDGDGEGRVSSVLIKRLVKRTANFVELQQFNPSAIFTIAKSEIADIHRVIPWRELTNF